MCWTHFESLLGKLKKKKCGFLRHQRSRNNVKNPDGGGDGLVNFISPDQVR